MQWLSFKCIENWTTELREEKNAFQKYAASHKYDLSETLFHIFITILITNIVLHLLQFLSPVFLYVLQNKNLYINYRL